MTDLSAEQREMLRELAGDATPRPWEVRGHWIHTTDDLVLMLPDDEQSANDADYIVAACNAVPGLLADLDAAERRASAAEQLRASAERLIARMERDSAAGALAQQLTNANAQLATTEAERDALRARVAELEAMLPYEEGGHA
jgi:hypothetical protein